MANGIGLLRTFCIGAVAVLLPAVGSANVAMQCPATVTDPATGATTDPDVICLHLSAGDGVIGMADTILYPGPVDPERFPTVTSGYPQYIFGFSNVTGSAPGMELEDSMFAAQFPAPTVVAREGQTVYLTLTNAGMSLRPDLFDPHTIHWHGFPNASQVWDGVPGNSISINMKASLTYFYNVVEPGTFMYHCHVEATEHMQMGMLGNLYVRPAQDGTVKEYPPLSGRTWTLFAYNDGDGSTGYTADFPIQVGSFDPAFHDASANVQPLPFAEMTDKYPMLNGRGYPHSVAPDDTTRQPVSSKITAAVGDRVLLRLSNLNVTRFYTLTLLGLPMTVVGNGSRKLGPPNDVSRYFNTNSVTLGGGEAMDVIVDTAGVAPGTYFLYTTNLNYLSNNEEDYGGMMTEFVVVP